MLFLFRCLSNCKINLCLIEISIPENLILSLTDNGFYWLAIDLLSNFKEALTGCENSFTDIL
jgi:hypothetical protein